MVAVGVSALYVPRRAQRTVPQVHQWEASPDDEVRSALHVPDLRRVQLHGRGVALESPILELCSGRVVGDVQHEVAHAFAGPVETQLTDVGQEGRFDDVTVRQRPDVQRVQRRGGQHRRNRQRQPPLADQRRQVDQGKRLRADICRREDGHVRAAGEGGFELPDVGALGVKQRF